MSSLCPSVLPASLCPSFLVSLTEKAAARPCNQLVPPGSPPLCHASWLPTPLPTPPRLLRTSDLEPPLALTGPSQALRLQGQGLAWVRGHLLPLTAGSPGLLWGAGGRLRGPGFWFCPFTVFNLLVPEFPYHKEGAPCAFGLQGCWGTAPLCQAPGVHSHPHSPLHPPHPPAPGSSALPPGDRRGGGERAVGPPDSHCQLL